MHGNMAETLNDLLLEGSSAAHGGQNAAQLSSNGEFSLSLV